MFEQTGRSRLISDEDLQPLASTMPVVAAFPVAPGVAITEGGILMPGPQLASFHAPPVVVLPVERPVIEQVAPAFVPRPVPPEPGRARLPVIPAGMAGRRRRAVDLAHASRPHGPPACSLHFPVPRPRRLIQWPHGAHPPRNKAAPTSRARPHRATSRMSPTGSRRPATISACPSSSSTR